MFNTVRQNVNLLQHIADDLDQGIVECGTNTYRLEDDATIGCPFCSHKDCFKLFYDENAPADATYHCFSCSKHGSVIDWYAERKGVEALEATKELAKLYNVQLPNNYSPIQEVFDLAARYYQTCLLETCNVPQVKLGKMTPLEYQLNIRKHKQETIEKFQIGWSDGGLVEYLSGLGFDDELLLESGLISKRTNKDFLPFGVFIYPHKVNGKVSHFTFKDPSKKLAYQLPNKFVLNGHEFYGQDTIKGKDTVFVCEGENDLLSVIEADDFPPDAGVIATIGSISGSQIDWIRDNLSGCEVVTLFDPDEAGNKYREKLQRIARNVKGMRQLIAHETSDIDEILKAGESLGKVLETAKTLATPAPVPTAADLLSRIPTTQTTESTESEEDSSDSGADDCSVIARRNCYYKVKYNKEAEPTFFRISDFTIKLNGVHIKEDGERHREVVITKRNGKKTEPFFLTSANKVGLGPFKTLVANAADGMFKGTDHDLADMWTLIEKDPVPEVYETRIVGWNEKLRSWVFRNIMVTSTGDVIRPDENGVFWIAGQTTGIKPESLTEGVRDSTDIPALDTSLSKEETDELLVNILKNLSRNIGDVGNALILLGWAKACMFSHWVNSEIFPFLYFWGSKGEGKTTLIKWLAKFYGIGTEGHTAVRMIGSAVGLMRKAEYYSSLPLLIDEMRADQDTERHIALFRTFYDKTSRSVAANNTFGVRTQRIRSCFAFIGEDQVEDPAFKERCVSIRVPVSGRETTETYHWMEENKHLFSNIGYKWILESCGPQRDLVKDAVGTFDKELVANGCTKRNSKHWAMVGYFGNEIAKEFCPDFDFKSFLVKASRADAETQREESTLATFFNQVEMLRAEEDSPISNEVMMVEGNKLHIWFIQLFRFINKDSRSGFPFSRKAVTEALKDEPYFVHGTSSTRVQMGLSGEKRAVITLDLSKAPEFVKSAAGYGG